MSPNIIASPLLCFIVNFTVTTLSSVSVIVPLASIRLLYVNPAFVDWSACQK